MCIHGVKIDINYYKLIFLKDLGLKNSNNIIFYKNVYIFSWIHIKNIKKDKYMR